MANTASVTHVFLLGRPHEMLVVAPRPVETSQTVVSMNRIALVARLKPGAEEQASALLERGPPFDPAERGFARHAVYLSAGEVVFVFEGDEVEWIVDEIVNESFGAVAGALGTWRELVEDPPRIARPVYTWGSDEG
jgi:hypothetical protein